VILISREIRLEMREMLGSDAWPVSQPRWAPHTVRSQAAAAAAPHAFMSSPRARLAGRLESTPLCGALERLETVAPGASDL
jgi:hypothetical protein